LVLIDGKDLGTRLNVGVFSSFLSPSALFNIGSLVMTSRLNIASASALNFILTGDATLTLLNNCPIADVGVGGGGLDYDKKKFKLKS